MNEVYAKIILEQYILKNLDKPWHELAELVNDTYTKHFNGESLRKWCAHRNLRKEGSMKKKSLDEHIALHHERRERSESNKTIKALINRVAYLENTLRGFETIKPISTHIIKPRKSNKNGESVAVVVASDWHIEETVSPDTVSDMNEYTLEIARARADEFFRGALRLTEICSGSTNINTMVLALLGDFISGDIHDELLETCSLQPVEAIIEAKNIIASGIEFLLKNSKLNLVIPCHSGNHARTTKQSRHATEAGHSLEYAMYHYLADHFRNERRVKFLIPRGYHSFVDVLGTRIRFHHGHNLKYGGGVGGLTIPVNKAIAQWNKTGWADLDVFGHWHQRLDGGNFIANGSMIGFNAYAVSIKAGFEKPSQTFFLINKERGKTAVWPITFS